MKRTASLLLVCTAGVLIGQVPLATGASDTEHVPFEKRRNSFSIHEVKKAHVNHEEFVGSHTSAVNTTDGKTRTIELAPMLHKGAQVMRVKDNNFTSYMSLNGDVRNGDLLIHTKDKAAFAASLRAEGW